MTTDELRVLYILRKHGGTAKQMDISQAMHRRSNAARKTACANLENLELISSANTPTKKGQRGPGAKVFWLTGAGIEHVKELIANGELVDPRARTGARNAAN